MCSGVRMSFWFYLLQVEFFVLWTVKWGYS